MKTPKKIFETKEVISFLYKRQLTKQYQKAKQNILSQHTNKTSFKERQPKGKNIFYFRINKQFIAL